MEMFSVVARLAVPAGHDLNECNNFKEIIERMKHLKIVETDDYVEFELLFLSDKKVDAVGVAYCHWKTLKIFETCFDDWINVEDGGSDARNCERFTMIATHVEFSDFRDTGESVTTTAEHSAARIDGTHRTVKHSFDLSFSAARRRSSKFRFPVDAQSMVDYGKKHLSKPLKKDSKVKWRYFECIDNETADFLRTDKTFTYYKCNQVVDKMVGINDQHRFRFAENTIRAFKTFTMHDKPSTY